MTAKMISFNTAISVCERGRQREQGMTLINKKHETADVISFSAAISACEKERQLKQTMAQLHKMRERAG